MSAFLTLFDLIGELARRRYQLAEKSFATLGLNHTEARLLSLLRHQGGAAPQDVLSNMLSVDRTNAGRALQRLAQEGFLVRSKDDEDKRANRIEMTAKGRKATLQIARLREQIAETFFGDLNEREAGEVAGLLQRALAKDGPSSSR